MQRLRPYPRILSSRLGGGSVWQPVWVVLLAILVGGVLTQLSPAESSLLVLRTAVLVLTLIEPLSGLFVALLTGPLGAIESGLLDSGQFFLLMSLLAWVAHGLRDQRLFVPRTFLGVPLSLFTGVTALSVIAALSYSFSFKEMLKWIEI